MKTALLNIMRGQWAIHPEWVAANMPRIERLLKGEAADDDGTQRNESTALIVDARFAASGPVYNVNYYSDLSKLPSGSTVVVDVLGPITKYGGWCSYGSLEYAELTERLSASDKVKAILFNIDSPGGQVAGTSSFADSIKVSGKRTIAFINDGYAASAGYWIASACDEIYCSHEIDQVGSIGVYCTIADLNAYYEKQGLKIFEVYAPQSTDKNGDVKALFDGKPDALKEELRVIAATFISTVQANRGDRLTSHDWSTGRMYYAPAAQAIGLIDGIKSFPQIMEMIDSGETPTSSSTNAHHKSEIKMFGNKLPKTYGLKGKAAADITAEDLQAANAELHANGIDPDLTLQSASANQQSADELASANEALEASQSALATATQRAETAEAALAQAQSDLAAEKKKPGASFVKDKKAEEKPDGSETDLDEDGEDDSDFEHNKAADAMLGWGK